MRIVLIKNNKVVNATRVPAEWPKVDGAWQSPPGVTVIATDQGNIGDTYANGVFTPADPVVDTVTTVRNRRKQRIKDLLASRTTIADYTANDIKTLTVLIGRLLSDDPTDDI